MHRIALIFAGLLALCLLAGCATLSKEQCQAGDWRGVGVADGENGRPASRFADHIEACGEHAIVPDRQPYEAGRQEGLRRYCTVRRAEEEGLAGRPYYDVCTGEAGLSFSRVYRQAGDVRDVQDQIDNERNEMDRLVAMLGNGQLPDDQRLQLTQSIQIQQLRILQLELNRSREEAELRAVVGEESARLARL